MINLVQKYKNLTKDERKAKLEEIILESFYDKVKNSRISRSDCSLLLSSEPLVSVSEQVGSSISFT